MKQQFLVSVDHPVAVSAAEVAAELHHVGWNVAVVPAIGDDADGFHPVGEIAIRSTNRRTR